MLHRASAEQFLAPFARRAVSGFEVFEFRVIGPLDLPAHAHDYASLSVLLLGGYTIRGEPPVGIVAPMAAYLPSGVEREVAFGSGTSQFLWIRLPVEVEAEAPGISPRPAAIVPLPWGRLQWVASNLVVEMRREDRASGLLVHGLLLVLLGTLLRNPSAAEKSQPSWLSVALEMIHREASPPPIGQIAARCGLHPTHFTRAFRRHVGCAPSEYVRQQRVSRARLMLDSGESTLATIAGECGFSDQAHLAREFKRITGISPSAFRRRIGRLERG